MRSKRWILGLCAVALTVLLAACGEYTPDNKLDKLLIYEVFTGPATGGTQWIELYNNTDDEINLADYKLVTSEGEIPLKGKMAGKPADPKATQPRRFVVTTSAISLINQAVTLLKDAAATQDAKDSVKPLPASFFQEDKTIMGQLNPDTDLIVLKKGDEVIDQVGWGNVPADVKTKIGVTNDIHMNQASPKGDNISLGRTPNGGVFPSGGAPGYFTLHSTPSPGIGVPKPDSRYNFFLGTVTDLIGGLGGIVLWLVFILIALIARRFQVLAEQKTYWEWLMIAPIGIFIYDVILGWNYYTEKNITSTLATWSAFGPLFLSGVACLYVINIFRLVAKNILESE
jgi:hypothetical protein